MRPVFLAALLLAACDTTTDSQQLGYEDGCADGTDIGYINGLMHGETCADYDDTADERYAKEGDAYEAGYNSGYADCYTDGYADGYYDGSSAAEC